MCTNDQTDLPTNQATLDLLRLQAEIRKLLAETHKLRQETGWNLKQAIPIFLAILAGVSPLIIGGLTYRQQVAQYVHTLEQEQTFRVTKVFIDLVVLLTGEDAKSARAGALALAKSGEDAVPFLIENLDIAHNEEVYTTIGTSLRLIARDIKNIEDRRRFLENAHNQLLIKIRGKIQKLLGGRLSKQSAVALKAQIRVEKMLRSLATKTEIELQPLVSALGTFYGGLQSATESKVLAKEILDLLSSLN